MWKTPKLTIQEALQQAVIALKKLDDTRLGELVPLATLFAQHAKKVTRLVNAWIKHQTPARLEELVEAIYHLRQVGELQRLFDTVPNRLMPPDSRKSLLNIINKVSRYREAARFLCRTANRFPLVQKMRIVLVDLPQKAYGKVLTNKYNPMLQSTISRIATQHEKWDLDYICRIYNTTVPEASNQFAQQTKKTLKEAKIHAEIQLLYHCELNTTELPTRIICSSKDACFLCNAFLLMHGKIYTPRCHGRLYPGWRLPLLPKIDNLGQTFNKVLENLVRNSLRTLVSRNQKIGYSKPNESTLLTLPASVSTLRSLPSEVSIKEQTEPKRQIVQPNTSKTIDSLVPSGHHKPPASSRNTPVEPTVGEKEPEVTATTKSLGSRTSQLSASIVSSHGTMSSTSSEDLLQGHVLSKRVKFGRTSRFYSAGHLEIQINNMLESSWTLSTTVPKELDYSIQWLTAAEAKQLQKHQATSIVNAESLEGEDLYELDHDNAIHIAAGESVVKLLLRRTLN
jgi:hypothetical protein